ncbi:MAG: DUF2807 domain-containing protein [Sphingomonas sp.]|uniref:GIN domain-containing protein n=1 Tax=Sphingomonas sp. TaxID=28214 RepID=UPI001B165BDD|nr:DUF2807 domain-containing protein [Sphingomonas sp.]MBO9621740.1 DUF2807 domain-containing protein [Sphingomonas sp.]
MPMRRFALLPLLVLLAAAPPAAERRFLVTSFDRLRVEGQVDVELAPGSPGAVASGDRAAIDALSVRIDSGTLVVRPGEGGSGVPHLRLTAPAVGAVQVNGGGHVRVAQVKGDRVDLTVNGGGTLEVADVAARDLALTLSGTGAITAAGKADRVRARSFGAGSIDAARLTAGDAVLVSQSSGDLSVAARYTARATALGTGAIRVGGRPECHVSGPGPVECAGTAKRD